MASDTALKALDFSAPFVYAAAIYSLCAFLDRNASASANNALGAWLHGGAYTGRHVATLAVQIFERLFGPSLFSFRALFRSLLLTFFVTALIVYTSYPLIFLSYYHVPEIRPLWTYFVVRNILTDYCSLFIVRRWLIFAGRSPLFALLFGPLVGAVAIYLILLIFDVVRFSFIISGEFHWRYFAEGTREKIFQLQVRSANSYFTLAAFVMHGWMVLFAIGMGTAKLINSFRSAGVTAQWLLHEGETHPFKAVGLVASIVTFIIVTAVKLLV